MEVGGRRSGVGGAGGPREAGSGPDPIGGARGARTSPDLRPPTSVPSVVDLHTHTIHSDGRQTPSELVAEAAALGLRVLGLTDHDTVGGIAEATAAADRVGIELVPGVELSTGGQDGTREIHLLGYFIDPTDSALLAGLDEYAQGRLDRLGRMARRLADLGVPISAERVRELAGPGTVGRPHVAQALIEAGHAADLRDAFDRFLGAGKPGFVPRPKVEPEDGIGLILGAGGVPVLAHPLGEEDAELEATLRRLVPAGLRGLEVYYGEYDDEARARLAAVADRWGLIATGGSDYHGPNFRPGRVLGGPPVPLAAVDRLRAAGAPQPAPAPTP